MRRRALSSALVLAITVGLTLTAGVPAQAAVGYGTVGGVTYRVDDAAPAAGATALEVLDDAPKDLTLPASVTIAGRTYAVVAVEAGAGDDLGLTSLALPDSLVTIGDSAFAGNQLTSLAIPDSVTTIGTNGFARNQLTALDLPDALTLVDEAAFAGNALATVELPDSLTRIASAAFAFNALTRVTVPASVTGIAAGAFTVNPDLATVTFAGPPPTEFSPTGSSETVGSLGDESSPTVFFPAAFAAPGFTDGYTAPTWQGYDAQVGLGLQPAALPQGRRGTAYDQTITATGGVAPYTFTAKAGSLPPGLTLSPTGQLSGTPSRAGSFRLTVTATDTLGSSGATTYTVAVVAPTPPTPPTPTPPSTGTPRLSITGVTRARLGAGGFFRIRVTALNRGPGVASGAFVRIANRPTGVRVVRGLVRIGDLGPGQRASVVLKVRAATNRSTVLRVQARARNADQGVRLVKLPRR